MKSIFTIALLCLFLTAAAQDNSVLVSPEWLNQHQKDKDVVIVQVNFLKMDYDNEHIEGARFLWPGWLSPDSPNGSMELPEVSKAAESLGQMGISNQSHVVLYYVRNEVSPTTRMFLVMEYLGLSGKVSVLNGGIEAWKKAGYPVTKEVPVVKKTSFKPSVNPVIVDRNYVLSHLKSEGTVVVDARAARFYDGEPTGNPRDGHIAGAKNIPYQEMVDQNNMFKPADQLQTYFTPVVNKNQEAITYCFIGQTASVVYFAGRMLGYNMKLYDGSMQEWSRIPDLPMEKSPGK